MPLEFLIQKNPILVNVNTYSKFEKLPDSKVLFLDESIPVNPTISHDGKKLFILIVEMEKTKFIRLLKMLTEIGVIKRLKKH